MSEPIETLIYFDEQTGALKAYSGPKVMPVLLAQMLRELRTRKGIGKLEESTILELFDEALAMATAESQKYVESARIKNAVLHSITQDNDTFYLIVTFTNALDAQYHTHVEVR